MCVCVWLVEWQDNFLIGLESASSHFVHIIDMGLCKRYRDPKTREHIPFKENKKMIGTPRYASVNAHRGIGLCLSPPSLFPLFSLLRSPLDVLCVMIGGGVAQSNRVATIWSHLVIC